MKVKFLDLTGKAVLPKRATEKAAGYDLSIPRDTIIEYGRQVIKLEFAIQMPDNLQAHIEPRSGFSAKGFEGFLLNEEGNPHGLPQRFDCEVLRGKVDPDYTGSVGVIVHSRNPEPFFVKKGTRVAQMSFSQFEVVDFDIVDKLDETERGDGGWGHSGTQKL